MFSREGRVRLFLAFLILVLVLTNSQSLQVSYNSRIVLSELFETQSRELSLRIAFEIERDSLGPTRVLTSRLASIAEARGLGSACVLVWNGRLVTGGDCPASEGGALDRLDDDGRRELERGGWSMTDVAPRYDVSAARAFGYLALNNPETPTRSGSSDANGRILRIEVPAPRLAETNRQFRTTLVYQVSALSLVLLAIVLFLNSMLAPHRRLVAEARSVASELSEPGPEDQDEGEFLLTTFQDVVARLKEKELELQALHRLEKARADETEALASDIIRSMTTGLVSLDPSGAVVLVNPAAEKIFGVAADEVRGRPFAEVFPGSSELAELARAALSEGTYHLRGQAMYQRGGASALHLGVSVIPLLSTEGGDGADSIRGALCLLADLTEVVELRERLFLKENLARLGEMVAGIAHEFRNGLATIMGNAKLLQGHTDDESREIVEALLEESQSLSRVVSEFLQFARPESIQFETLDLGELLAELSEELGSRADESGIRLVLDETSVHLEGDEHLLRKAFSNLVVNAIESLAEAKTTDGEVRVELATREGLAVTRVRDNGPGVPETERDRIFTPFYTGKADGTGLGLSVVQKIVVSHNGTVELENTDCGASFVVSLPLTGEVREVSEEWV
jgi:PAS domain S-box-containing protein